MSYYDNTVASYDSQISSNNARIGECNARIRQLEDDIADLRHLRGRVTKVDDAVETAASNTSNKINNLPSVITNPFSFLKMNYFSSFLDVLKGSDRTKARNGISGAFSKIDAKIRELENEIQRMKDEIGRCNANISSLNQQKRNYISNMERKIAEEAAARRRAEEAAAREAAAQEAARKAAEAAAKKPPMMVNNPPSPFTANGLTQAIKDMFKKR